MTTLHDPILITPRDAARLLSVSERTLFTWSRDGTLPPVRIGRIVRYDVSDIRGWISRQKTSNQQQEKNNGEPLP